MKRSLFIAIAMLSPGFLLVRLAIVGRVTLAETMIVVTIIVLVIGILARQKYLDN
jgi:hypothetical protein